jgi:hypothetical protein
VGFHLVQLRFVDGFELLRILIFLSKLRKFLVVEHMISLSPFECSFPINEELVITIYFPWRVKLFFLLIPR